MAFTVSYSFNYNSADSSDYIANLVSSSFSADEMFKSTMEVAAGTDLVAAPVIFDFASLSPTRLILVTVIGADVVMDTKTGALLDADTRVVKEVFLYDGNDLTALHFGNVGAVDAKVTVVVFA